MPFVREVQPSCCWEKAVVDWGETSSVTAMRGLVVLWVHLTGGTVMWDRFEMDSYVKTTRSNVRKEETDLFRGEHGLKRLRILPHSKKKYCCFFY